MFLLPDTAEPVFPDPAQAQADGMLAIGGRLSVRWLANAYQTGIFPWFSEGDPIVWYSPQERFVLYPAELQVSKSMNKILSSGIFRISYDEAFEDVIDACSNSPRNGQVGTWITAEMKSAYLNFHRAGYATSVEVWKGEELAGGLYGVRVGEVFCGESMFSRESNASKAGLITLCREKNYRLIDCQVYTQHLESLGARMISRNAYLEILKKGLPL